MSTNHQMKASVWRAHAACMQDSQGMVGQTLRHQQDKYHVREDGEQRANTTSDATERPDQTKQLVANLLRKSSADLFDHLAIAASSLLMQDELMSRSP